MSFSMQFGKVRVGGSADPCLVVAELGINHNGDVDQVYRLIDAARQAGCGAVKFQKRTVDVVYSAEELAKPRESVFGKTNGDLKRGLELSRETYDGIDHYCKSVNIMWFASCWDQESVDFIAKYDVPCIKMASPSLTDTALLTHARSQGKPIMLSTGMSTRREVDMAVSALGLSDLMLMHTVSSYPTVTSELHLSSINTLRYRYMVPVGYSGHEQGTLPSVLASVMGACVVERHFTLDKTLWGSDQALSLEPWEMNELVHNIQTAFLIKGNPKEHVLKSEVPALQKLRRV